MLNINNLNSYFVLRICTSYALQFCLDTLTHFKDFRKSPVQVNVTNSQAVLSKKVTLIIKHHNPIFQTHKHVIVLSERQWV